MKTNNKKSGSIKTDIKSANKAVFNALISKASKPLKPKKKTKV